jgi:crotonobetaine/carnitine-CoA ligase
MTSAGVTPATLLAAGARDPERIFVVAEDADGQATTVTYATALARAGRVAAVLAAQGVRPGDRVHVQLPNCLEFYDLWFATALAGAVLVPTGPQSTADELGHVLGETQPVVSVRPGGPDGVTDRRTQLITLPELAALATAFPERGACPGQAVTPGKATWPQPTDLAAILYTSGTTSRPKGVMVTNANYVAVGEAVARHLGVTSADRWLIALPLFHANAQYYCTMSALVAGASLMLAPRFSASGWARQAADHAATLGSLFAAPVRMILAQPPTRAEQRTRLRAVLFAQNLSEAQAGEFERRFGTRLLQLYGMTETVLPPTMNPDGSDRRWHSIGRPVSGVRLRVADSGGADVPLGDSGELLVHGVPGQTVAAGYYRNPEATDAVFGGNWLRTGDLVRADADGFLYFVDRSKDMIKRSGENVSASEIERVAAEHPAIAECAAIGVPDPVRDEAIVLIAVLRQDMTAVPGDIIAWCRTRLASYKVPSSVVFTDTLPRTSVGKIRKDALRPLATLPDR